MDRTAPNRTAPNGAGPDAGPRVGSVAEEAARLLNALGALTEDASERRHRVADTDTDTDLDADRATDHRDGASPGHREGTGTRDRDRASGRAHEPGDQDRSDRCTCGAQQPPECGICPLCRGIRLIGNVHPDVLVGLADLLGEVATSLRVLAQDRADRGQPPWPGPGRGSTAHGTAATKG